MSYIETFGAIPSPKDIRDYKGVCAIDSNFFPEEFELLMTGVKNQGTISSCVAHALASTIEHFNIVQGDSTSKMSVGFIYGNRAETHYQGEGMIVSQALDRVKKCGSVIHNKFNIHTEMPAIADKVKEQIIDLLPDAMPNKISSYFRLDDDDSIKASLMQNGPVIFTLNWFKDIKVVDGIITTNFESSNSYHCMIIYGWNEKGWKIQNSWGSDWGDHGKAILPYNIPRAETWGIADTYSEAARKREIETLNNRIVELEHTLLEKAKEFQNLQAENIEDEERYVALENEYEIALDKIFIYEQEILHLQDKLLEIEKPYNSSIGQIIAKVINFFYNLCKKKV